MKLPNKNELRWPSTLGMFLMAAALLFALAFGPVSFFQSSAESPPLFSLRTWQTILLGLAAGFGWIILTPLSSKMPAFSALNRTLYAPRPWPEAAFFGGSLMLGLVLLSDLPWRLHTFLPLPLPVWALAAVFCLALGICRFATAGRLPIVLSVLLGACIGAAVGGFLLETKGELIFTDDHPAFLYRLIQLRENFPAVPFYNPMWNAGVEAREFFPSGSLNVFMLFSPLIYLLDPQTAYNLIVLALLWVIAPLAAFFAARVARLGIPEALSCSIISLASSISWYRWTLAYGTMGFAVSALLVPLDLVLAAKLLDKDETLDWKTTAALILCVTLTVLWSPSILLLLPVGFFGLYRLRTVLAKPQAVLALIVLITVNAPWVAVFYKVSKVGAYVSGTKSDEAPGAHDASKFKAQNKHAALLSWHKAALKIFRENANRLNPLVLFFGITGLFLLKPNTLRALFSMLAVWAFLLGTFGPLIKPQLELERMYVVLGLILSVPAAALITQNIANISRLGGLRGALPAVALGLMLFAPFWLWKIATNRTTENYTVAGPLVRELTSAIQEHSREGRTLFAGFILHELNSGHVAPLAAFTKRPLIASSYQHDSWRYKDVIPDEYRRREDEGVNQFLELMNVSTIVTHDRHWRSWFSSRPKKFRRIWKSGAFVMFERLEYTGQYFLSGTGKILEQNSNGIVIKPDLDDVVLKFRYLPFLEAPGCQVLPYEVSQSLKLVRLRGCANHSTTLRASSIVARLLS